MKLVSNNAYTYFLFDHTFHLSWLLFKGAEFDVRGALEANQLSAAYISCKQLLHWAVRLYIYTQGAIPSAIECYMFEQLDEIMPDKTIADTIRRLFYSCAESDSEILNEIEQAEQLCYVHLIPDELWDFIGRKKEFNLNDHIECVSRIGQLFDEIAARQHERIWYPTEATKMVRDIGNKVVKGK